jgi:UDP-N-acetyl-D-mannosaminuronic acid dehydrogenase
MKKNSSVCIIGLGFVGLTLAAIMAKRGFRIYGVEKKKFILNKLEKSKSHFYEPGLDKDIKYIIKKKKFTFHSGIPNKKDINTYIISVGTPLSKSKKIITKFIEITTKKIAKQIKDNDIVILRSTVKIGTTRNIVGKILTKTGKKFKLAFCPERAVEGAALKELNYLPQIIGGLNNESKLHAKNIFKKITSKIVMVSNLETAEMIKLIDNSSRDVFFAYANEIARTSEALGLNANEVINCGKLHYDRTFIASPGLVGGPCLHKDPYIFSESLKKTGTKAEITLMARKINERQPSEIVRKISNKIKKIKNFSKKPKIVILGIAFKGKPITDDLRGSMSLEVYKSLKKKFPNSKFYGFDPVVPDLDLKKLNLEPCKTLKNSFLKKDLVIIGNNHPIFSNMKIERLAKSLNNPGMIYDFWNHFDAKMLNFPKQVLYNGLGGNLKNFV